MGKEYQASGGSAALADTTAPGTPEDTTPSGGGQSPDVCVRLHGRPRTDDSGDEGLEEPATWTERHWMRPGKERQAPREAGPSEAGRRAQDDHSAGQIGNTGGGGAGSFPLPITAPALVLPASSAHHSGPTLGC